MKENFGEENILAREQKKDFANGGYHFDKLHDQNETVTGEKLDLETGNPIKNDQDVETPHRFKRETSTDQIKEELQDDITTKWLLENGYDEFGNEIGKKAA